MATMTLEQAFALAIEHHRAGRLVEAERICALVLSREPNHADALHMLGIIHCQSGRFAVGADLLHRAIALKPNSSDAYCDLGNSLTAQGKFSEAIAALRRAIALKPDNSKAHDSLAAALTADRQFDEAIAACRQAIALEPANPSAHCNLGHALRGKGQFDQAIVAHRQVVSLTPNFPGGHIHLGNGLAEAGRLDEAIAAYRQAISLKPDYAEAFVNLGNVLTSKGRLDDAIDACRRAIALNPNLASAHSLLGMILLLTGNFREGWAEYEHRLRDEGLSYLISNINRPRWEGSPLPNGTILLHAEQGFGDAFQFVRYVSMVAERCAKVVVMCRPEAQRVLRSMGDVARWMMPADPPAQFDAHCPLLSLPRVFGTTIETIPGGVPYLRADLKEVDRLRERGANQGGGLRVGIAWAGAPTHVRDRNRSIPLSTFAPLARLADVTFYSLQKGEAAGQAKNAAEGMKLIDWTDELADFADTAAFIASLDLVIAADTAVVHLAGAMGKPVWTLLPFMPDWRWMLNRNDTPWYPTMRLFRQPAIGDWESVIREVSEALRRFAMDHGDSRGSFA